MLSISHLSLCLSFLCAGRGWTTRDGMLAWLQAVGLHHEPVRAIRHGRSTQREGHGMLCSMQALRSIHFSMPWSFSQALSQQPIFPSHPRPRSAQHGENATIQIIPADHAFHATCSPIYSPNLAPISYLAFVKCPFHSNLHTSSNPRYSTS